MSEEVAGGAAYWLMSAVAFAFSMTASPGPNNAMLASSGATFGFTRTFPHMLGISLGFPAMFVAIGLGVGELLHANPLAYEIMKWCGAAYLVWLAWRIATNRPAPAGQVGAEADAAKGHRGRPLNFLEAALFQWVNPKAWLIAMGGVAAFTTRRHGVDYGLVLMLGLIFLTAAVLSTALWTVLGLGVSRVLQSRRAIMIFNQCMAALLVASLVPLLAVG